MKKIKVLMLLCLSLILASCSNDTYVSKRHPEENNKTELTEKSKEGKENKDGKEALENSKDEKDKDSEETKETKEAKDEKDKGDEDSDVMAGVNYQVEDVVNMRSEPSTDSEIVGEAHPGDEILVLLEKDGWSRVSIKGQAGYIKSDLLKPVK
ncbi:SH3 domain-containing protein [Anaerococcus tetradius]|uniref:SH3 domain-containing protein n=1 Tax=Anaerococcus tetradius TaxID=33036 RepID=UPI0023F04F22|nr:SH3 domain-containing protein [Anaerococcus tetradius]